MTCLHHLSITIMIWPGTWFSNQLPRTVGVYTLFSSNEEVEQVPTNLPLPRSSHSIWTSGWVESPLSRARQWCSKHKEDVFDDLDSEDIIRIDRLKNRWSKLLGRAMLLRLGGSETDGILSCLRSEEENWKLSALYTPYPWGGMERWHEERGSFIEGAWVLPSFTRLKQRCSSRWIKALSPMMNVGWLGVKAGSPLFRPLVLFFRRIRERTATAAPISSVDFTDVDQTDDACIIIDVNENTSVNFPQSSILNKFCWYGKFSRVRILIRCGRNSISLESVERDLKIFAKNRHINLHKYSQNYISIHVKTRGKCFSFLHSQVILTVDEHRTRRPAVRHWKPPGSRGPWQTGYRHSKTVKWRRPQINFGMDINNTSFGRRRTIHCCRCWWSAPHYCTLYIWKTWEFDNWSTCWSITPR